MSDHRTPEELTPLDALKQAIARVEQLRPSLRMPPYYLVEAERDAWRTAFEWRDSIEFAYCEPGSYTEGLRLIREHLK